MIKLGFHVLPIICKMEKPNSKSLLRPSFILLHNSQFYESISSSQLSLVSLLAALRP